MAVRALLAEIRGWLCLQGLDDAACGKIEIALAEALNNVVEHASLDSKDEIALDMTLAPDGIGVELRDRGAPLPGLTPPRGDPPTLTGDRDNLPEGGFGWFLIRTLTTDLHYARTDGKNHLSLRFAPESKA
ncbi:MAG: ATP-binding protein [Alphaproteobacteria bacterium HGW-Alphaproteobacteria-1]|nr:MAG: ATP-binding protein [Alphaproteobacteria bacterium HGW-Alphaproteobacteria-1]